jgi:hypothetical protein
MTIDHKAVSDMANIMSILNGKTASDPVHAALDEQAAPSAPTPLGTPTGDKEAMKEVLMRLQGISTSTTFASQNDRQLAEALQTERTPRGARVGKWEIVVNEGTPKTYDVVDQQDTVIAQGLFLYEAALGLVKRLNEGAPINSQPVRDLLKLEEDYARNRSDAVGYKERSRKLREKGEDKRAAVNEDRFDEAQRQALTAHEEILRLAGLR